MKEITGNSQPVFYPESLAEYRATCQKFRKENISYYTENNFYRGKLLPLTEGPTDEGAEDILADVKKHYEEKGDILSLLRFHIKMGNKNASHELANKLFQQGTPLEIAHAAHQMWTYFNDSECKERAIKAYREIIERYKKKGLPLMTAVYSDLLYRLTGDEDPRLCAIAFHRQAAKTRGDLGDSWWQAISLREIAKISKEKSDMDIALQAANYQIKRAATAGDFKNAGLWARDIAYLQPTDENKERAENLFNKQIEISTENNDTRSIAKSYWEMWKVSGKEEHRKAALSHYNQLLIKAKAENNQERVDECYRVLLYITQ